jgi:hypothetical protein
MDSEETLLQQLKVAPGSIEFNDVISTIEKNYNYNPTEFTNGVNDDSITNNAGNNEGSCKIFAFARLHGLTDEQTLHCFGTYYRDDVLNHPDNNDHRNIRLFMIYGWQGIIFEGDALKVK